MSDDEPMPAERPTRRRRLDVYEVKSMIRAFAMGSLTAALAWGVVLGDVWLWRQLYGH